MIKAEVIADSLSPQGNRLTTMVVTFPRFILAELNTHRMFSRNSASSRAIPFEKMVRSVQDNPFVPIAWQKNHKGMQGTAYFDNIIAIETCEIDWLTARDKAVAQAIMLSQGGVTKQLCNRLLEPFMWHTVIITATHFENFFELRCPRYHSPVDTHFRHRSKKDCMAAHSNPANLDMMHNFTEVDWLKINEGQAEIHMMALAEAMWDAMNESTSEPLVEGMWHIPFMSKIDSSKLSSLKGKDITEEMIKISTGMCARISYTVVGEEDKPANYENDIKLHDRLIASGHWSPFEHCARVMSNEEYETFIKGRVSDIGCEKDNYEGGYECSMQLTDNIQGWCLNYRGFIQYRHFFKQGIGKV